MTRETHTYVELGSLIGVRRAVLSMSSNPIKEIESRKGSEYTLREENRILFHKMLGGASRSRDKFDSSYAKRSPCKIRKKRL